MEINAPGSEVLDGYRLIRFLGRGGFGEVWLCRSESMGDYRALKFIPTTHADRLEKEYEALVHYRKAAAQLRSPHLVLIEHVNRNDAGLYYVMPLADGSGADDPSDPAWQPISLATLTHGRGEMPTWFSSREIIALMQPVLAALQTLSDAGLVHRDVKPENILIFNGRPCLGDISLLGADASVITRRGTAGYSAPSWYLGGHPDMYGIAATLYTLLTGNSPDRMGRAAFLWPPQGETSLSESERAEWKRLHGAIRRATDEKISERFVDFTAMADSIPPPNESVLKPQEKPRLPRFFLSALTATGVAAATVVAGFRAKQKETTTGQPPPPARNETSTEAIPELTAEQKADYQALAGMIQGYVADGEYASALASVDMLLSTYPQSRTQPAYSIARAIALNALGRAEEAKAELRKDLHLSPNIASMAARKDLWVEFGDLAEAEKDLSRILKKHGPGSFPLFLRADVRAQRGDFPGVHADKQAAYDAAPEEIEQRRLVDSMWSPLETKYPGYHDYVKTLPPDPYYQTAEGAGGPAEMAHDDAWVLSVFNSILSDMLNPGDGLSAEAMRARKAMVQMSRESFENGDYGKTLSLLNQALDSIPPLANTPPISLFRSLLLKRLDRQDEAESELVKLCHRSHDPRLIDARVCLLSALDRKHEAEALLTRMLDAFDPTASPESVKQALTLLPLRARIRAILGNFPAAEADHAAALALLATGSPASQAHDLQALQALQAAHEALLATYPAYAEYLESLPEK